MYRFWYISHSHGEVFEARFGTDSYKVDLGAMSCSCRLWDLSGIPCVHAIAAINYVHKTPDGYCNAYFTKEKLVQTYSSNIQPVNGSNLWEQTPFTKPLPPLARRMPGRPATKRRRHASEVGGKFSSKRVSVERTVRCGRCLEYGHNQKGCKNDPKQSVPQPPKKRGRPRKNVPNEAESSAAQASQVQASQAQASQAEDSQQQPQVDNPFNPNQTSASRGRKKMRVRRGGKRESRRRAADNELPPAMVEDPIVTEADNELPTAMAEDPIVTQDGTLNEDFIDTQEPQPGIVTQEGGSVTGHDLHSILDEVEQGINDIIGEEVVYNEDREEDVLPEKVYLDAEDIEMYLGAGYTMEELQGIRGVELEGDHTPLVELVCYFPI